MRSGFAFRTSSPPPPPPPPLGCGQCAEAQRVCLMRREPATAPRQQLLTSVFQDCDFSFSSACSLRTAELNDKLLLAHVLLCTATRPVLPRHQTPPATSARTPCRNEFLSKCSLSFYCFFFPSVTIVSLRRLQ